MNILVEIWKDKLSKICDNGCYFKFWITGLLLLFVVGFTCTMYGIISGEGDVQNVTFGIFDTLG